MTSRRLCADCDAWILQETDTYCSWCGSKLVSLAAEIPPEFRQIFQDRLPEEPIRVLVRNDGQVPLDEVRLATDVDWLEIETAILGELEPSAERFVEAIFDPDYFPDEREQGCISVQCGDLDVSLVIELNPPLRLVAEVQGGPVRLTDGEASLIVEVRAVEGETDLVTVAESEVSWALYTTKDRWPFTISTERENAARINVRVDEALLAAYLAVTDPVARRVSLPISVQTAAGVAVDLADLAFDVVVPPRVRFYGVNPTPSPSEFLVEVDDLLCGGQSSASVELENTGDEALRIESADVDDEAAGWLRLVDPVDLPLDVLPGSASMGPVVLAFTLDGLGATADCELSGGITLRTNAHPHSSIRVLVAARPRALGKYSGTIAIDYGTTNSCVMYQGPGDAAPMAIELKDPSRGAQSASGQDETLAEYTGNPAPTSEPSVVLYQRFPEDGSRDYLVGVEAEKRSLDRASAPSVVRSAKRWLGHPREFSVFGFEDHRRQRLRADVVSTDVVAFLVRSAERQLRARITECVITYPVKFSWAQVEELRTAFERAGVVVAGAVPEPVAAGLDFIRDWTVEQYSLLVCDLGGGTSDLSLFRVERIDSEGSTLISPVLLGADTENWFGGDDVTEAAIKEIQAAVERQVGQTFPVCSPIDRVLVRNPREMEYGTLNWGALRLVAERAKIGLSDGDSQPVGGTVELSDSAGEVRAYEWTLTLSAIEDRIRHKFERLVDMARTMVTSARERQLIDSLDVILMAGNASQFPLARQVIREAFPQAGFADELSKGLVMRTNTAAGLKECVASGACWIRGVDRFGGSIGVDQSGLRVSTATIGVTEFDPVQRMKVVITVGDRLDTWMPAKKCLAQQTVQVVEDAGGGETRQIVTFRPDEYCGLEGPVEVHLLVDERGQVMVRLDGTGGKRIEVSARDIAAGRSEETPRDLDDNDQGEDDE